MNKKSKPRHSVQTNTWICIAHNYSTESASGMSYHLAYYLASEGYNILFISHRPYFKEPVILTHGKGQIHIYSWPTENRPTGIISLWWYIKIYLRYRPCVTIGHFVGSNITLSISKILSLWRHQTYVYYHTLYNANILEWRGTRFMQKFSIYRKRLFYKFFCDHIICPSDLAREDFRMVYSKRKDCKVIPNAIVDRYGSSKQYVSTNSDEIIVSYLGRLDAAKGVLELIEVFKDYISNNDSRIKLQIAGYGSKSDEIIKLSEGIPQISMLGRLPYHEVDDYIKRSNYMIIPSLYDNLPTVGLESMMNGIPVLLSNQTGLAVYLCDSTEGFLFDPTHDGIYNVFERVEKNIGNESVMGHCSRETFLKMFSLDLYCKNLLAIITESIPR